MTTSSFARSADPKRFASAAFTLIELLVVISIIAVLAGILLPVAGGVMENAKKVSAKDTMTQVVSAVKSFQTDYGAYPTLSTTQSQKDTTVGGTVNDNQELFGVLRATDVAANSPNLRRVVYFEGKDVKTITKPKDGFVPTGATMTGNNGAALKAGDFVDPWGNQYFICYDSGYTDQVPHPYDGAGSSAAKDDGGTMGGSAIRSGVIAWCYGKDGLSGKNGAVTGTAPAITSYGDDVISWQ